MMILTDDDTRAFGPESCFGGPDDRDPMYDDAPDGLLKCDRGNGPCCLDDEGKYVGPGCCHCCPPDAEAIHTGFEIWDRPDFYRLRAELHCTAKFGYCLPPHVDHASGRAALVRWIGHDHRLARAAQRKLELICDDSETHDEAKARYEAWAVRARIAEYRRTSRRGE